MLHSTKDSRYARMSGACATWRRGRIESAFVPPLVVLGVRIQQGFDEVPVCWD